MYRGKAFNHLSSLIISVCFFACSNTVGKKEDSTNEKDLVQSNESTEVGSEDSIDMNEITEIVCTECDGNYAAEIRYDQNYSNETLQGFFCSLDKSCTDNVEFSQLSNYSFFIALEQKPAESIEMIAKLNIDESIIQSILENPVSDRIDVEKIYTAVMNTNSIHLDVHESVKKYLSVAVSKSQ